MIERITDLVKKILINEKNIKLAVDMTAGNGNDSFFIIDELNPKKLVAFDIQKSAKENTESLLGPRDNFTFILDSHENIDSYIKEPIDLAIYNLGYLPNGDKSITTLSESTLLSLKKFLTLLRKGGKVCLSLYPGHDQGRIEAEKIETFIKSLPPKDYAILKLNFPNKGTSAPYIIIIEKKSRVI